MIQAQNQNRIFSMNNRHDKIGYISETTDTNHWKSIKLWGNDKNTKLLMTGNVYCKNCKIES